MIESDNQATNLKFINLAKNRLANLPESLLRSASIKNLILYTNKINFKKGGLKIDMPNGTLSIGDNHIETLNGCIGALKVLEVYFNPLIEEQTFKNFEVEQIYIDLSQVKYFGKVAKQTKEKGLQVVNNEKGESIAYKRLPASIEKKFGLLPYLEYRFKSIQSRLKS
jgi:hypothetical protein